MRLDTSYVKLAAAALVLAAVAVALVAWTALSRADAQTAQAPVTIGFDMSAKADSPAVYGSRLPDLDSCVDVNTSVNGGRFYFDIVALNVDQFFAYLADLTYTPNRIQIINVDVKQFFGQEQTVLNLGTTNSNPYDSSISPAVSDGTFRVEAFDVSGGTHTGSGVLARIEAQALPTASGEVAKVTFTAPGNPSTYGMTLTSDPNAYHPGDINHDGLFDGPYVNRVGTIAIDRPDSDGDGVSNTCDNCPTIPNGAAQADVVGIGNQQDSNRNGAGDACDPDDDGDGVIDAVDNCPMVPNTSQIRCSDADADAVPDVIDNCPSVPNYDQNDFNEDGTGDACQDSDGDGFGDALEVFVGSSAKDACAIPYDTNDDFIVDASDAAPVADIIQAGGYDARFDVTMDGVVDARDADAFASAFGLTDCGAP